MAQELTFNISEDRRQLQGPVEAKNFNLKFGTDGSAITHGKPDQWVQGRIGDDQLKQVFVNITEGEGNTPKDVAGMFLAFVGIIHDKDGRPHRVVDYKHSTTIDVEHGRFRFDFPDQAFTVAGEYQQAFFMLIKEGPGGGCVATMEFDMQVMANFVFTDLVPEDYITPFNDTVDQLLAACKKFKDDTAADEAKFKQELDDAYAKFQKDTNTQFSNFKDATDDDLAKFKKANADDIANFKQQYADAVKAKQDELQNIVNNYTDKIDTMLKDLNQQGIDTSTMLTNLRSQMAALQDKIEQEHLFTQDEAKKFEEELTSRLFSKATTVLNTVDDMKKDAGLTEGQVIITLGEYEIGDGGGATYRITKAPDGDSIALDNGLKAERIYLAKNNYYDEVTVTDDRVNHTNIYFATIPKEDRHGQPITPYIVQNGKARIYNPNTKQFAFKPAPSGEQLTPTEYARKYHTTLTVNGSSSININNIAYPEGNIIGDGKILNTFTPPEDANIPSNFGYIGFKQDRSIQEYPFNTTAQQMLDDGVVNSWVYYWPLIKDGKVVDDSTFVGNEGRVKVTANDPRIGLGIKADGTLIIAACDGRSLNQKGLTSSEFAQEMLKHGCVNAWHLDGGGSTSLTYKGLKLNRNIDDNGAADRAIPFTFNIKKTGADTGIADAFSQAGAAKQDAVRQLAPEIEKLDGQTAKWFGNINFKSDNELESWLKETTEDNDWRAKSLSGIITTDYHNSAAGKAIDSSSVESWYATISWIQIAGKEYGSLKMTSKLGASDNTLYRSLYQSQWSDWIPSDHPHELVPSKVDKKVSVCKILRSGMTIQVDVKVLIDDLNDWTNIVEGLPHPIDEVQEIQLAGDNKARAMVTTAGVVIVKGEAGLYYLHLTYFTNDKMD